MKKALFLLIAVIACCFLLSNADIISSFVATIQTGAMLPLVAAVVLMLARHLTQAQSYKTAFEAVGFSASKLWDYIVLIFSLVFINTFCLFSGATGVAFIIDDAHRKGADLGISTSGAVLSQIGYFAAILVISIIGFVTMIISGQVNMLFVIGGLLLAGTLIALSSMFIIGYFKPDWLYTVFDKLSVPARKVYGLVKKEFPPAWGSSIADSFIKSARIMGHNPSGTVISIGWASFSAILNMTCLVAIGYAFGFEEVAPLIAAFSLAAISVILSPTPQGVGVVEAAIAAVLTAAGCSLASATAIALVYRGIMFWIPFCLGAVLLSQSGFFSNKKNPTQLQHDKDMGWVAGTLVGLVGLVNIGLAIVPAFLAPYNALVEWISFGDLFAGPSIVVMGLLMIVLAVGLIYRYRTVWAITITSLVLVGGTEFLFYETIKVAVPVIALAVWLFWKREAFDRKMTWPPTYVDTYVEPKKLKGFVKKNARSAESRPVDPSDEAAADDPIDGQLAFDFAAVSTPEKVAVPVAAEANKATASVAHARHAAPAPVEIEAEFEEIVSPDATDDVPSEVVEAPASDVRHDSTDSTDSESSEKPGE